jgi:hypothetical protein
MKGPGARTDKEWSSCRGSKMGDRYNGVIVEVYTAGPLIENIVLAGSKAVRSSDPVHCAQCLNYAQGFVLPPWLLLNSGNRSSRSFALSSFHAEMAASLNTGSHTMCLRRARGHRFILAGRDNPGTLGRACRPYLYLCESVSICGSKFFPCWLGRKPRHDVNGRQSMIIRSDRCTPAGPVHPPASAVG